MGGRLLVIDGPMKGQLVPADIQPVTYIPEHSIWDDSPQIRSYWLHSWTLLGRVINVLSVHADATTIELADLWEALISGDAKAASGF